VATIYSAPFDKLRTDKGKGLIEENGYFNWYYVNVGMIPAKI